MTRCKLTTPIRQSCTTLNPNSINILANSAEQGRLNMNYGHQSRVLLFIPEPYTLPIVIIPFIIVHSIINDICSIYYPATIYAQYPSIRQSYTIQIANQININEQYSVWQYKYILRSSNQCSTIYFIIIQTISCNFCIYHSEQYSI